MFFMDAQMIKRLQGALLAWHKNNGRHDLPWRNLPEIGIDVPYGVMVSEFMLQQTQVERVIPKYLNFLDQFPTIELLAASPVGEVIRLWAGLGYNRRAVLLHKAAQAIHEQFNNVLPQDSSHLMAIPGIGPYTTGAILAFGYNRPYPFLDTNIERFYELLFWGYAKPKAKDITAFVEGFIPERQSRNWHSGTMDLMTLVRREKTPNLQQQKLLEELQLLPTWDLPKLLDQPLHRPKQSMFKHSKRYYRGRLLDYIRNVSSVKSEDLEDYFRNLEGREAYEYKELLSGLKKDGLIAYAEPIWESTKIRLG